MMARFNAELPLELMKQFEKLSNDSEKMVKEMTAEGAKVAYENIKSNMKRAFKDSSSLEPYLKITKSYRLSDGRISTKVAFYGYKKVAGGYTLSKKTKSGKRKSYHSEGVPVPLIVAAREYGTSRGEAKKPFIRPAFKKAEIKTAMLKVQDKYLKEMK